MSTSSFDKEFKIESQESYDKFMEEPAHDVGISREENKESNTKARECIENMTKNIKTNVRKVVHMDIDKFYDIINMQSQHELTSSLNGILQDMGIPTYILTINSTHYASYIINFKYQNLDSTIEIDSFECSSRLYKKFKDVVSYIKSPVDMEDYINCEDALMTINYELNNFLEHRNIKMCFHCQEMEDGIFVNLRNNSNGSTSGVYIKDYSKDVERSIDRLKIYVLDTHMSNMKDSLRGFL